jgi:hypothetical protein
MEAYMALATQFYVWSIWPTHCGVLVLYCAAAVTLNTQVHSLLAVAAPAHHSYVKQAHSGRTAYTASNRYWHTNVLHVTGMSLNICCCRLAELQLRSGDYSEAEKSFESAGQKEAFSWTTPFSGEPVRWNTQ